MPSRLNILSRLLLLSLVGFVTLPAGAADQPAFIKRVYVSRRGEQVQVRLVLSRPVVPLMSTASAPERVLLDLPDTSSSPHQHRIAVDRNGVHEVRYGLNQASPLVTRLVVDLQRASKYEMTRSGNEIVLTITPGPLVASAAASEAPKPAHRRMSPPAAANAPWFNPSGRQDSGQSTAPTVTTALPAPARSPGPPPASSVPATQPVTRSQPATFPPAQPQQATLPPQAPQPLPPQPVASQAPPPQQTQQSASQPQVTQPQPAALAPQSTPQAQPVVAQPQPAQPTQAPQQAGAQTQPGITVTNATSPQTAAAGSARSASPVEPSEPHLSTRPAPAGTIDSSITSSSTSAETIAFTPATTPGTPNADIRTVFRVKYVADGAVYLDGGRADGLGENVGLVVLDKFPQNSQTTALGASPAAPTTAAAAPAAAVAPAPAPAPTIAARLKVISVAQNSAVCGIDSSTREVKAGDLAYLSSADAEALVQQRALSSTRVYPQVITFTEGDPMDEEVRDEVPRPPLPEVNRTRMRIGFDYGGISSRGASSVTSSQFGMVVRTDMTRIGGSYWNLQGYWRGRFNTQSSAGQPTMQDLLNRTYTIGFTYDSPQSRWVAGVGRLYLPWATSLDVIDGGYGGRRFGKSTTVGLFAGSTPDPTSWSYNPDQRIAGTFINFQGGDYQNFHYTSTSGMGVATLLWQINRPFVFLENGVSYKRFISVYQALQADKPKGTPAVPSPGAGVSRSFVTVRVQPIERLSFDFNHNYFRDVPTYNLTLVGTGLLDKVLFQGFSAGARLETIKKITLYTEQGLSSRSGDAHNSMNQMYGISFGKIFNTGLRADLHYAKFNSSFAHGNYRAFSLSRNFGESFQGEVQVGKQAFISPFSTDNGSKFLNLNLETQFGAHYFFAGGYNLQRGLVQNYDQWYFTLGYRFDNRAKAK